MCAYRSPYTSNSSPSNRGFNNYVYSLPKTAWVPENSSARNDASSLSPKMPAVESNLPHHSSVYRAGCTGEQHVGFKSQATSANEQYKEREKYLTAKYPKQTMSLIRKRLAVEDWMDEQLKIIYNVPEDSIETYDANIDLDEILDIDDESGRYEYIQEQISDAPQPRIVINRFVADLLKKAREL